MHSRRIRAARPSSSRIQRTSQVCRVMPRTHSYVHADGQRKRCPPPPRWLGHRALTPWHCTCLMTKIGLNTNLRSSPNHPKPQEKAPKKRGHPGSNDMQSRTNATRLCYGACRRTTAFGYPTPTGDQHQMVRREADAAHTPMTIKASRSDAISADS